MVIWFNIFCAKGANISTYTYCPVLYPSHDAGTKIRTRKAVGRDN